MSPSIPDHHLPHRNPVPRDIRADQDGSDTSEQTDGFTDKWPWECRQDPLTRCDEHLRNHPADIDGLIRIAESLWDMKKRGTALDFVKRLLTRHPGDRRLRLMLQKYSSGLMTRSSRSLPAASSRMTLMPKFTIYAVTLRDASQTLGIREISLACWERKAGIRRYPGRNGYTAPEFNRLRACLKRRRGEV